MHNERFFRYRRSNPWPAELTGPTGDATPTQDVDEQLVQLIREQRAREAVEVVRHRLEDVPLEAGVGRLLAVVLRPWKRMESYRKLITRLKEKRVKKRHKSEYER